ncbi:putative mitochondrial carrier C29A3.11c [Mycena sanguinolenta]|uniref:Putative mitochondrial carrier C29A3.11c n=1 Tax=Mycena sanguinolenta TaxID=230812 RepID=A0A8H6YSH1_9AGAR|nr:putative mitochondrial carrier C29A3.11c [Mycena sanguinolenta]
MDGTRPTNLHGTAAFNESLRRNKAVVCALSASYISTFAGYPLDSLKSRLQTIKTPITVARLAGIVYREEGIVGFYRGLWIPLVTISFVRAASFTIYTETKDHFRMHNYLNRNSVFDAALVGGIGGAMSGSLISFGSAPFELVKVRRQLEYTIAASRGIHLVKVSPGTCVKFVTEQMTAARYSGRSEGNHQSEGRHRSLPGFPASFRRCVIPSEPPCTSSSMMACDTYWGATGSGFCSYVFFAPDNSYTVRNGEQGETPSWLPIHSSLVPFVCGSLSGVTSWALIYPLDVVKTKVQQRALAGERYRGVFETLHRLVRGPDPAAPKPILAGCARIYRGLGVSALRSITTHGLLWTFYDLVSNYIDRLPQLPEEG